MQNEENTNDTQVELQESEVVAAEEVVTKELEAEESQSETPVDDTEARLAKAEAEAAKYRRLFEKTQKPQVAKPVASSKASPLSVEEAVLQAQGMSDELLNELKAVAQARGISSLIKAQNDSIFIAVKEKFEKEQKQKQSSMPASRGAGQVKAKKTIDSPGLSREEHKAMLEAMLNS